jgi:hypothetical protein
MVYFLYARTCARAHIYRYMLCALYKLKAYKAYQF